MLKLEMFLISFCQNNCIELCIELYAIWGNHSPNLFCCLQENMFNFVLFNHALRLKSFPNVES